MLQGARAFKNAGYSNIPDLDVRFRGPRCVEQARHAVTDLRKWPEECYWKNTSGRTVPSEDCNHAVAKMWMHPDGTPTGYMIQWYFIKSEEV